MLTTIPSDNDRRALGLRIDLSARRIMPNLGTFSRNLMYQGRADVSIAMNVHDGAGPMDDADPTTLFENTVQRPHLNGGSISSTSPQLAPSPQTFQAGPQPPAC